jgi:hypothetical protein
MGDFTASNGVTIRKSGGEHDDGYSTEIRVIFEGRNELLGEQYDYLDSWDIEALREFFRHEEDERLGRWRWPENPDYLVYPDSNGWVHVLREENPLPISFTRELSEDIESDFRKAAREFFNAHPEPKHEWHDAKPGELWAIRLGEDDEQGVMVETFDAGANVFQVPDGESISITRPSITSGRRVWPEDAS